MVWAGITYRRRTDLVVVQGNLNAQQHCDAILMPIVIPFVNGQRITFQQDNARPHTTRISMNLLAQHHVDVLPWPAMSPDLSPIEHCSDELGRRV